MTDVAPYQQVLDPCIPCYSSCAPYTCKIDCSSTEQMLLNFTITGLDLPAKKEELNLYLKSSLISVVFGRSGMI
jgi:hypothetical protein